ncbi:Hsp20/alpha crystallin family protein [Bacillus solitudinis]|uniref:Hsp20/alpha crystallin family protein n=1 Tax=Bacillus solitudinis TaxID=2014074 RepID=UPI000C241ADB|nr:Hsp20/alpha crystallin family protein [Bacillus solitudinis]
MSEKHSKPRKLPNGYQDILRSIDDFFQQTYQQLQEYPLFNSPIPTRVIENKDVFIIEADLPGIDKNQIQLDIYRQSVRIRVHHHEEVQVNDEKLDVVQKQASSQVRERIIPIPFAVSENDVTATYRNGLLRIKLPNNRRNIEID